MLNYDKTLNKYRDYSKIPGWILKFLNFLLCFYTSKAMHVSATDVWFLHKNPCRKHIIFHVTQTWTWALRLLPNKVVTNALKRISVKETMDYGGKKYHLHLKVWHEILILFGICFTSLDWEHFQYRRCWSSIRKFIFNGLI